MVALASPVTAVLSHGGERTALRERTHIIRGGDDTQAAERENGAVTGAASAT